MGKVHTHPQGNDWRLLQCDSPSHYLNDSESFFFFPECLERIDGWGHKSQTYRLYTETLSEHRLTFIMLVFFPDFSVSDEWQVSHCLRVFLVSVRCNVYLQQFYHTLYSSREPSLVQTFDWVIWSEEQILLHNSKSHKDRSPVHGPLTPHLQTHWPNKHQCNWAKPMSTTTLFNMS